MTLPRPSHLLAIATLICALLAPFPVSGQISFSIAPAYPVASGPRYLAFGDFNDDGVADVVVSSADARLISVLAASSSGAFSGLGQAITIGRHLGQVATQDFTEDGLVDFAVISESGGAQLGKLLIAPGFGDGSFAAPIELEIPDRRLKSLVSADFDRANGPDFAIAHGAGGAVRVYLNNPDDSGFTPLAPITINDEPRLLAAGQMSRDNLSDLAVLNTAPTGSDEVVILQTRIVGEGASLATAAQRSINGPLVVSMLVSDVTRDGLGDIVLLHEQVDRRYAVTTLVNTTLPGLQAPMTFRALGPITYECPRPFGGEPPRCQPVDLVSADFDRDGRPDLAITLNVPGGIDFLIGLGDGAYVSTNSFMAAGEKPTDIGLADVTGDRQLDLVIADSSDDKVITLRNTSPPGSGNGSFCTQGDQCASAICLNDVCCSSASCTSGQRCDIPGNEGFCTPLLANGLSCRMDSSCASTSCTDLVCCDSNSCSGGRRCDVAGHLGVCTLPPGTPTATELPTSTPTPLPSSTPVPTRDPNGAPCSGSQSCESLHCRHSVCCSEASCAVGERCDIFGNKGNCTALLAPGAGCEKISDCSGNRSCSQEAGGLRCSQTPGPTPESGACVGDCDNDDQVTVDELLTMIDIALGQQPIEQCSSADISGEGEVSVDEILAAVRVALDGCPMEPDPTATAVAGTATATVPSPTATVTAPPMTPSATPTPSALSATATPVATDFRSFTEFQFDRFGGAGFCAPLDQVFSATIRKQGESYLLELSVLREGHPPADECLVDFVGPVSCATIVTVVSTPAPLTSAEVEQMLALFGAIALLDRPDPECATAEPCVVNVARWDTLETADYPCQESNRLPAEEAGRIVEFLSQLAVR